MLAMKCVDEFLTGLPITQLMLLHLHAVLVEEALDFVAGDLGVHAVCDRRRLRTQTIYLSFGVSQ